MKPHCLCPFSAYVKLIIIFSVYKSSFVRCQDDNLSLIHQCYDSPADLFQVYPQLNSTFKVKIKNKCLQPSSLDLYLFAFDLSIVDQIFVKEVDQLDTNKLNSIRINRPVMVFGLSELSNFKPNSKFKLAIVFFDHTGVVKVALHPKVFNFYSNNQSSSTAEILLIIVLGVLLLITCILLIILIYINYFGNGRLQNNLIFWRKSNSQKLIKDRLLSGDEETGIESTFELKSNVIPVEKLLLLIPNLIENDTLKNEYNSVPKSKLHSWSHGRLPENKTRNRYANLLPYDQSRVVLKKDSPVDHDYINANFIDGHKKSGRYIAMQGPIDTTIDDFWRCVWQFKCHQIVMLTNLEEGGKTKCEKYWPDLSQIYGKIKVICQKTELFADYTIRNFLVEKNNEKLTVIQYHFVSWPDHTVPLYACTLISFMNRIRSCSYYKENSPIIVHCSAGIGRTGAYILIDSMMEMAKRENKIDILGHFCKMRLQRINMVEKSQYIFVYQVLFEALSHESTDISCNDFSHYFEKLTKTNEKFCPLYKQFEILNNMSSRQLSSDVCKFGMLNFKFNRRQDVIPPDYARVILPNLEDYINAVYVNGYRKQDAYIVTQIPFENNRTQFWKMIKSTGTSSIVLLGEINMDDHLYWPSVVNKKIDFDNELTVVLQKEEITNHVTVRTFLLKPTDQIVRQFQLKGIDIHLLHSASPYLLVDLREKLDQYNIGTGSPLVVQCIDGVQLSGLYCSADFIFERIKEEQQIDVFLAVQKIRSNRPQFITSYDQYLYLHQVSLAYLQSFDQYANFK